VAVFAPPTVLPSLPGGVVRVADLTPGETGVPVLHPGDGASAAAFLLSAQTARHLPAAAQAAKAAGVPVLSLPPLPFHLVGRLGPPLASPRELESLWRGEILPSLSSLRGVRFEIHDRFLLERFREAGLAVGPPPSDAGCQAGTALVYVGPGGELFPCPLWPVPLGILSGEWDAVWQGGARRSFLEELVPHRLCAGCPRWDGCFGGCPGAAVALGVDGVPDPLCPEAGRD
jgi:radical SAM protein with 4Fe4S-binding SPASM domain